MNFWETTIDYSKARKVLVIPNITNSKEIEKDSFVDVLFNHIKALEKYGEYFWHVLLPTGNVTKKLNNSSISKDSAVAWGGNQECDKFPIHKLTVLKANVTIIKVTIVRIFIIISTPH